MIPVSLWEEGSTRCCCWERPESPFSRGGTSWTESLWKAQRTRQKLEARSRQVDDATVKSTQVRADESATSDLLWLSRADLGVPEDLGDPGGPRGLRRRVTQQIQGALRQFGGLRTRLLPR